MHALTTFAFVLALAPAVSAQATVPEIKTPRPVPYQDPDAKGGAGPIAPGSLPAPRDASLPTGTAGLAKPELARTRVAHPTRVEITQVLTDRVRGVAWARGADYKASFDNERATFIPFLGSSAARNFPLTLETRAITVGGQQLELATSAEADLTGTRASIDRNAVVESFDLGLHSMEQAFTFTSLPTRGELSISIGVESELTARATDGGLEFGCALGGVRYGRATAIDASGRRLEIDTRLVDGAIQITCPAQFVTSAKLPLVIDPTVSTFAVDASSLVDFSPDIAYDAGWDRYCAVYEQIYSDNDHDVVSVILDSSGNVLSALTTFIDFTTDSWTGPRVAENGINHDFLVAATVDLHLLAPTEIGCRARSVANTNMSSVNVLNGTESGEKYDVSVGGDPNPTPPTYFLVAWRRDFSSTDTDIHARLVDADANPLGSVILIDNSGSTVDYSPSVSRCDGNAPSATQEWNVAYARQEPAQNTIRAAQVHWDGGITTYPFMVDYAGSNDYRPAASSPLDGQGYALRPWAVAFETPFGATSDITAALLVGGIPQSQIDVSFEEGVAVAQDHIEPSIDCDGRYFGVAYSESYNGSTTDYDTYGAALLTDGVQLGVLEAHSLFGFSSNADVKTKITSTRSGGGAGRRFAVAWASSNTADSDVLAALYDSPSSLPPISYCHGDGSDNTCPCGNSGGFGRGCANSVEPLGALLSASGDPLTTSDTFQITADGMPPGTTCLFFQGQNPVLVGNYYGANFGDGLRCVGGGIVRLGTAHAPAGSAIYPDVGDAAISVRGQLPLNGGPRYYQAWYRNSASFCTASTFNLTNGVAALWIP